MKIKRDNISRKSFRCKPEKRNMMEHLLMLINNDATVIKTEMAMLEL